MIDRGPVGSTAAVSMRADWLELPTYVCGPDSRYPDYGWLGMPERYPYSTRTDISTTSQKIKHRVVILENEYLRATVLPDVGGRLYSLFDKLAGQETFFTTPSLKYQNVSFRGAWVECGIEFNFGQHHHTVNSVFGVNWTMQQGQDGSASVWVGSVIMPIESRWALRITLRPGRAALDLEIHTASSPFLPAQMYWWTNASVEVTDQSRFFYFGKYAEAIGSRHGWPICDGLDYTWRSNRLVAADMFLIDCQRDYMAYYDYSRNHGVANTADRLLAQGQKYWTWGMDPDARSWDPALSDDNRSSAEIQRGRAPTQGVNERFEPMTAENWCESWVPLRQTNGFSSLENDLVLSVSHHEPGIDTPELDTVDIRLLGVCEHRSLTLEAWAGEKPLGRWTIDRVAPDAMFSQQASLAEGQRCDRVKIVDAAGKVLMDWRDFAFDKSDWFETRKLQQRQPASADPPTADSVSAQAEWLRFSQWPRHVPQALELYSKALALDGGHVGTLRALAEINLYNGLSERAMEYVNAGLLRNSFSEDLLALRGSALLALGRTSEAVDAFAQVARKESGRRRGLIGLAMAYVRLKDMKKALQAVESLLASQPADAWAGWMQVILLRKAGRRDEAQRRLSQLLLQEPLWHRLHAEALLLGVKPTLADGSRKLADDSLAAAMPYLELGLWDDARTLLQIDESNEVFSPALRLAHLAYAQHKLGDATAAKATLEQLPRQQADMAYAWQSGSIAIFQELLAAYGPSAMLEFMLGNVLASRHRLDEAQVAWQRAADAGLKSPIVHRNLARLALRNSQPDQAAKHYTKAWELTHDDVYLFAEYDRFLASRGQRERRGEIYAKLSPALQGRSLVAQRRVSQFLDQSQYEQALEEVARRTFFRAENERGMRVNYQEAIIGASLSLLAAGRYDEAIPALAKGLDYPANLHLDRSASYPAEIVFYYLTGLCHQAVGRDDQAREQFLLAVSELHREDTLEEAYEMLAWLALPHTAPDATPPDWRFKALAIAHRIEQVARGQRDSAVAQWYQPGTRALLLGLCQLAKGHVEEAQQLWQAGLEKGPDTRLLRLHVNMPRSLLERMAQKKALSSEL